MKDIDSLISDLLKVEGGYVNNPADRGGETNFGITRATARAYGYYGNMRDMPASVARAIYKGQYWTKPHFDAVALLSPRIAAELFDTGVNMGPPVAVQLLQRALNVLSGSALRVDGLLSVGGATLTALAAYLKARPKDGEAILLTLLNCFQGERYAELAERDPSQRAFINGWIKNRVALPA